MTKQLFMYRWLRPVVQRMPVRLWVGLAWLLAQFAGPWRALTRRGYVSAVLLTCGQVDTFHARRKFATRQAYLQLRRLDYYLHGACRRVEIDWSGHPPDTGRFCLVPMDTYGVEQLDALLQAHPCWLVRRRFDGELQASKPSSLSGRPWSDHCARLRGQINGANTIDIQTDPIKLRSALKSSLHIMAFQGFLQARQGDSSDRPFLGTTVNMQLGGVRLAQRAGIPLRFVSVLPRNWGWTILVDPAMPADEAILSARLQRALADDPASWTLWHDFLQARQSSRLENPDSSATRSEAEVTV